jgi:hypothetical protein
MKRNLGILFIVLLSFITSSSSSRADNVFKNGDLIFQNTIYDHSRIFTELSREEYNHVGILYYYHRSWYVFEAAWKSVRLVPLQSWISRGRGESYVVKRLVDSQIIKSRSRLRIIYATETFMGKPYDRQLNWYNKRYYAAELVWKYYQKAFSCTLAPLGKVSEKDRKVFRKYHINIKEKSPYITPAQIFSSPKLRIVLTH